MLWDYWEENLDTSTAGTPKTREALEGKYVVITGASSGIGQVTALKVAQAGGIPVLVARGKDKLEETKATIELRGGRRTSSRATCPTWRRSTRSASRCRRAAVGRLRRQQRRPLDPALAQARARTASTTSSGPCSSTTSARSG